MSTRYTMTVGNQSVVYRIRHKSRAHPVYLVAFSLGGERFRLNLGTRDLLDAEKIARPLIRTTIEHRTHDTEPSLNDPLLRDLVSWFINRHCAHKRLAQKTVDRYAQILDDFLRFCRTERIGRASQLSWAGVERWQAWLAGPDGKRGGKKRSATSQFDEESVLKRMFNAREAYDPEFKSPIRIWLTKKPRTVSKFKALRLAELQDFLRLIDKDAPEIAGITRWLAATGWRPDDAIDLEWADVDLRSRRIQGYWGKTQTTRLYPITDTMASILNRQPEEQPRVFPLPSAAASEEKAKIKRRDYLRNHMARCCERNGFLRVIPRDLRKTFGTLQANGDLSGIPCPPRVLQALMGHAEIETTLTFYADVEMEHMQRWAGEMSSALESTENL